MVTPKNYVARLRDQLAAWLPDCDDELIDLYTLLGLTFRGDRQSVHDAWAVWRNRTNPGHASLIPFRELSPDVQALDQPYVDAINASIAALYLADQRASDG